MFGKGKFGELYVIHQAKTSQILVVIIAVLTESIHLPSLIFPAFSFDLAILQALTQ